MQQAEPAQNRSIRTHSCWLSRQGSLHRSMSLKCSHFSSLVTSQAKVQPQGTAPGKLWRLSVCLHRCFMGGHRSLCTCTWRHCVWGTRRSEGPLPAQLTKQQQYNSFLSIPLIITKEVANHLPGSLELRNTTPQLVKQCFAATYECRSITILAHSSVLSLMAHPRWCKMPRLHWLWYSHADLHQPELASVVCLKHSIVRREIKSEETTTEKQISGAKGKRVESLSDWSANAPTAKWFPDR